MAVGVMALAAQGLWAESAAAQTTEAQSSWAHSGLAEAIGGQTQGQRDIGRADYVFVSDLAARGFEPFATSAAGNASFGMKQGAEMYLCFLADTTALSGIRNVVLMAEVNGQNPDREVPNIPVVCVLTQ
ncbi:hypothetical protein [Puniceibacterium sediminis]|uniref:Uncharacterized protein n=1 Tax=Puniceibacterium sediminis TaxID=1608407 RepID=A0A238W853_9RHOB|nr:hypothetical protein [Puniceibacterium sediminis]SNR42581.1 hypothetical protein SAMN06265370_104237 [Puniceibacterium sediminis]